MIEKDRYQMLYRLHLPPGLEKNDIRRMPVADVVRLSKKLLGITCSGNAQRVEICRGMLFLRRKLRKAYMKIPPTRRPVFSRANVQTYMYDCLYHSFLKHYPSVYVDWYAFLRMLQTYDMTKNRSVKKRASCGSDNRNIVFFGGDNHAQHLACLFKHFTDAAVTNRDKASVDAFFRPYLL